ncbi:MAG: Ldh family oxidoreductase [Pseudomonadota bacterium]
MTDRQISLDAARDLVARAFQHCGASADNARATAAALVRAEADGQKGHGLSRVASYSAQLKTGKVNGDARPAVTQPAPGAILIDAENGFAYPAIDRAIEALTPLAASQGIAAAAIRRSHHFGQAGAHVERLAERGLVALLFGNSPKAIAFWGGAEPMMGTNPIAFAAPTPSAAPLVIDLAVSVAARGKILAAQKSGGPIPEGWALDADGAPTTDPDSALQGSMAPMGGAKGAALALMVEVLAAALTGGAFGFEASSLFTGEGAPPDLGQAIVAIDPTVFSGGAYDARMAVLAAAIDGVDGARRPGDSRLAKRAQAEREGIVVADALYREIAALAGEAA